MFSFYLYIISFFLIVGPFVVYIEGYSVYDGQFLIPAIGVILLIIAFLIDIVSFNKIKKREAKQKEQYIISSNDLAKLKKTQQKKTQQKKKKASRKTSLKQPIQKGLTTLEQMYQDALKAKLSKDLISTLDSNYKFRVESIKEYKNGKENIEVAKIMIQYAIDEFEMEVRSIVLQPKIIAFLKKEKTKLPASDIDFQLKIGNVNLVKELCEEMYRDKRIGRTGNYRYFV